MSEAIEGRWSGIARTPGDSRTAGDRQGLFVIHATLLQNGRVLWFSGHAETSNYLAESYVWDPSQPIDTALKVNFPAGTDIFCCHHANLDDGRVITLGGAMAHPDHGRGIKAICIFDPTSPGWIKIGEMTEARWYPTLVTLPDGRLVVFSGRTQTGASDPIASSAELLSPPFAGPGYTTITLAGGNKVFPTYPGLHLVRGGTIFHTGTTWRYEPPVTEPIRTFSFRVTGATTAAWIDEGVSPHVRFREEGMSILLPPAQDGRILLIGGAKVNTTSDGSFINHEPGSDLRSAEILDTKTSPPTWTRIANMTHPRINLSAVLLPDGKVLVLGGHNRYKWDRTSIPSNQAEIYDPVHDSWTLVASMHESRTYHSAALLLPDGRVLVAGGVDPTRTEPIVGGTLNQKTMEFYQPPYFFNGPRPTIASLGREDGPNNQISYGRSFFIESPNAVEIRKVVLMRPGSMTHHTDTEQRYVPLDFVPDSSNINRLIVQAINDPSVAPPGYYMVWIVDSMNRPCQRAQFVRLARQQSYIILDRSYISKDEVATSPSPPTVFGDSFYVVMDGFLPSELGISVPIPSDLSSISPSITFHRMMDNSSVPDLIATPQELLLEDPTLPAGVRQRFTFKYSINVAGSRVFFQPDGTTPIETQVIVIRASRSQYSATADLTLTHQPNPYMLDGATPWLSIDLRVFQITQGERRFNQTIGRNDADALNFIRDILNDFNSNPSAAAEQFNGISTDQQTSRLELARSRDGRRAFNFAIAQVRYRGRSLPADNVRVFFRLFTTAATGMNYGPDTYARRINPDGEPIPVLGLRGGEIVNIPFFAQARVDTSFQRMDEQRDTNNRRNIRATTVGGDTEVTAYFGCWLDFNQTALRFPIYPGNAIGPYASGMKSIQELIRGRHQCLVAEVYFASDPIPAGATPSSNDNLSQRNLIISESDNPGSKATHTVQHTFEIKPTPYRNIIPKETAEPRRGRMNELSKRITDAHEFEVDNQKPVVGGGEISDELMINWGNLPRSAEVTLYFPTLDSYEILRLAALRIGPSRIERLDSHTIRCLVGDTTYVPIPYGLTTNIPGLITIQLPDELKKGQVFRVIVHQVAYSTVNKIIGSFELVIPVSTAKILLSEEERTLSVMRHIAESIPIDDRWYPIFKRYNAQLEQRIWGFGGNPDKILPSPDGNGNEKGRQRGRKKRIIKNPRNTTTL
jgi:hypothetical protein